MSRVRNFVEPFALSYPFVSEMVELEPAMADVHGGVSIASANDADGLLVLMLAYVGQAKNDTVNLCVNDSKGPGTTIAAGEENDDTPVRLPAGLLQKGLNRIKFTIKRTSGNEESTKELVLYHRTSPPGDTPPVMNLSVSHTIIGPEEAKKFKVTAIYENAQWYDRIITFINGVHFEYLLIPGSVSPLPPVPKSVVIDIPEDKLIEGGNDKTFEIKYRVVDYLTNSSGPPTWSDAVFVEVDLDKIALDPPTLVEATSPIDVLANPNGAKFRITFSNSMAKDKCRFVIKAPKGSPTFPLVEFDANKQIDTVLSQTFLAATQGKVIEALWNLNRNGGQAGKSPVAKFSVLKIASGDHRLPRPIVAGQTGTQLDIDQLKASDLITVDEWPHQPGELVSIIMKGIKNDGSSNVWELLKDAPSSPPGFNCPVPLDVLYSLKPDNPLTIHFSVSNFGPDKDTILFPEESYNVSLRPLPIKDIEIGRKSYDIRITKDGLRAFVTCTPSTILLLDLRNSSIIKQFDIGSLSYRFELSRDERLAYVTLFDKRSLGIFDTENFELITNIPTGLYPHDVKLSSDEKLAYVTNRGDESLSIIDIPNRMVIKTIPGMRGIENLAIMPNGNRAYVGRARLPGTTMYTVDLISYTVSSITVPGSTIGMAITPDGTRLFVAHDTAKNVSVIDTNRNLVTHLLTAGEFCAGIRISPDGLSVVACYYLSKNIKIINTQTLAITTIPVSNSPMYMDISPDGRRGYICSNQETWISVVALR